MTEIEKDPFDIDREIDLVFRPSDPAELCFPEDDYPNDEDFPIPPDLEGMDELSLHLGMNPLSLLEMLGDAE